MASLFPTRYEEEPSPRKPSMCSRHYQGSHDSLIFIPPLPPSLIERLKVPVGATGYENLLIYEFQQAGFLATNPCLSIHRLVFFMAQA